MSCLTLLGSGSIAKADENTEDDDRAPAQVPSHPSTPHLKRKPKTEIKDPELMTVVQAPHFGRFKLGFSYESLLDTGRKTDLETVGGENYWWRNEFFLRIIDKSGWGFGGSAAVQDAQYDDHRLDTHSDYDPSLFILHPNIYESPSVSFGGLFRQYFPASPHSIQNNTYRSKYYSKLNIVLSRSVSVNNVLMPNYFSQPVYADTDRDFMLEDETNLNWKISSMFTIGVGQYYVFEHHWATANGYEDDIYPFIDFTPITNMLFEARAYFPIYLLNTVSWTGTTSASIDQMFGEFFLKLFF